MVGIQRMPRMLTYTSRQEEEERPRTAEEKKKRSSSKVARAVDAHRERPVDKASEISGISEIVGLRLDLAKNQESSRFHFWSRREG